MERFIEEFDELYSYKFLYNPAITSWTKENRIYRNYRVDALWKIPRAAMCPEPVVDKLFDDFKRFIDYVSRKKGVKFVTTSESMMPYVEETHRCVSVDSALKLIKNIGADLNFHKIENIFYSPAEIFGFAVFLLAYYASNGKLPAEVPYRMLIGPTEDIGINKQMSLRVPAEEFFNGIELVNRELSFFGRMPSKICFKGWEISLGSFLMNCAGILDQIIKKNFSNQILLMNEIEGKKYPSIAEHPFFREKEFRKASYPENFTGRKLCRACRLQSWSHKPATEVPITPPNSLPLF